MDIRYKGKSLTSGGSGAGSAMEVSMHNLNSEAHADIRRLVDDLRAREESLEKSLTGFEKLSGVRNPTAQTEAQVGQIYINTATGQEFVCVAVTEAGTEWEERPNQQIKVGIFRAGDTPPEDTGLLWIDTDATTGGLKYFDGTEWLHVPVAYT